jgi:mannitol-specific phosphotransferase system IIBC component
MSLATSTGAANYCCAVLLSCLTSLVFCLLFIHQVLLMTEEEFQQLQQAEQEQQQQQQQQQQQARLDLGRDLLQGEFGELVATVLLQVRFRA